MGFDVKFQFRDLEREYPGRIQAILYIEVQVGILAIKEEQKEDSRCRTVREPTESSRLHSVRGWICSLELRGRGRTHQCSADPLNSYDGGDTTFLYAIHPSRVFCRPDQTVSNGIF
jgi:hypothetical protein